MEQTVVWIALLTLVVVLATRRTRPEILAAAALLLALTAGLITIGDASRGLGQPGLLLLVAVSVLAEAMSPATQAMLTRWFGSGSDQAPQSRLVAGAAFAAVASAFGQGSRVVQDLGVDELAGNQTVPPGDGLEQASMRLVLVHACMLGGLLSLLGNVCYPLIEGTAGDWSGTQETFGMFGLTAVSAAVLAVCALAGVLWLRTAALNAEMTVGASDGQAAPDSGRAIAAGLVSLAWLILVLIGFVYNAEGFIVGWLLEIICDILAIAASAFLLLEGRRRPVASRCLVMALALAMIILLSVPLLAAIGGAALVLAILPSRPKDSPVFKVDWSIAVLFALFWPVSIAMEHSGMAGAIAETVVVPLLNGVGLILMLGFWMVAVLSFANACGAIFTLVMLMPVGFQTAQMTNLDPRLFLSLLAVGTAAAICAPDLWGRRLAELGLSPRLHWRPLLLGQCAILVTSVVIVVALFD